MTLFMWLGNRQPHLRIKKLVKAKAQPVEGWLLLDDVAPPRSGVLGPFSLTEHWNLRAI